MRRNGFTLVELMVVLLLLSLAAGVVVLTRGDAGGAPREAAVRFATRVAAARDEAILTGRPMSVWVAPSGYGFDRLRSGFWEQLEERPFIAADWPEGTTLIRADDGQGRLRIRFDSLGLPDNGLSFRLERGGQKTQVRLFANGDVRVD